MAGRIGSVVLIAVGTLTSGFVVMRIGRCLSRLRARSHEHARAARIVGRPTDHPNVVVVEADRPAAYCVVGRPNAIIVTSAAMKSLNRSQLKAVLAHENAHISGRHHHILMALRALGAHCRGFRFSRRLLIVWVNCWRCALTTPPCAASARIRCWLDYLLWPENTRLRGKASPRREQRSSRERSACSPHTPARAMAPPHLPDSRDHRHARHTRSHPGALPPLAPQRRPHVAQVEPMRVGRQQRKHRLARGPIESKLST